MDKEKLGKLFDDIKEYINIRMRIMSLTVAEKTAHTLAALISSGAVVLFVALFLIFGSFAAAFALGSAFNSLGLGFLVVGCIYLLLAIITFALRKKFIEPSLINTLIKLMFRNSDGTQN